MIFKSNLEFVGCTNEMSGLVVAVRHNRELYPQIITLFFENNWFKLDIMNDLQFKWSKKALLNLRCVEIHLNGPQDVARSTFPLSMLMNFG
jgi:hypothetical protein